MLSSKIRTHIGLACNVLTRKTQRIAPCRIYGTAMKLLEGGFDEATIKLECGNPPNDIAETSSACADACADAPVVRRGADL